MKQLTIRGFDDDLAAQIERLANREGISMNQAVLKLLRKGAGLGRRDRVDTVGASLDDLIGTWTADEAQQIERAIEDFENIDDSIWE